MEAVSRSVKPKKKANVDIKNKEKINLKPQKDIPQSLNLKRKATPIKIEATEKKPVEKKAVEKKAVEKKPVEKEEKQTVMKAEKKESITDIALRTILESEDPNFEKLKKLHTLLEAVEGADYIKVSNHIRKIGEKEVKGAVKAVEKYKAHNAKKIGIKIVK